jgi:hypothetical protein
MAGLRGGLLGRWVGDGERDEGDLFDDVEAGAAEELVDDGLGEAAGVVLDTDGFFPFAEVEAADAVDLAEAGDGQGGGFGGGSSVAVEDVQLGHGCDDTGWGGDPCGSCGGAEFGAWPGAGGSQYRGPSLRSG